MPPLPVIADVYRVTLAWNTNHGVSPRNVIHVRSASSDVLEIGANIIEAWTVPDPLPLFKCVDSGLSVATLEILPLDGVTASVTIGATGQGGGGGVGETIPNGAGVVSFHTAQRGARGRGRLYAGPITEASQANGIIDGSILELMVEGWGTFITALPTQSASPELVIASYVHADAHPVTSLRVDNLMGTQRRRLDQLR